MSITKDEHEVVIDGSTVTVRGTTGLLEATWELEVDGQVADSRRATGLFTLRAELPDRSEVTAAVHQGVLGPTNVVVMHDGSDIARFRGFVA
jgi:hypothetical protein